MKRYEDIGSYGYSIIENPDGDYVLYEEAAAIIAEKDREIAELGDGVRDWKNAHALLQEQFFKQQEQLRDSNEQLVAAEARIAELETYSLNVADTIIEAFPDEVGIEALKTIVKDAKLNKSNSRLNLTALAEHDKELLDKAVERLHLCPDITYSQGYHAEAVLKSMAAELRAEG